ncbi:GDSL esterase/lipase At5g55050 [Linum perenne]
MATKYRVSSAIVVCLLWVAVLNISNPRTCLSSAATVPAVYIFGDSIFDVGTNDYLAASNVTANFPFYGIDSSSSLPIGRFSNGFNLADHIVKKMGFSRSPPPFLSLVAGGNSSKKFNHTITKGVNFASAGSGIFDSTGSAYGVSVVPMKTQIEQFKTVATNLSALLGPTAATTLLAESVFLISVGSNDVLDYQRNISDVFNNHFNVSAKDFVISLIKGLYINGAKKFGIVGIPALGCCPFARSFNKTGGCIDGANLLAQAFFDGVTLASKKLGELAPDANFSLGNAFAISLDFVNNGALFGLKEVKAQCCGQGSGECNQTSTLCGNRDEHLFWDGFHPTEFVTKLSAEVFFSDDPRYVSPISFSQL